MAGEQIRITGGPAAGQQIDVGQELQIGRSAGAEGRLGDDPEISRQHARFSRNQQGQLVVEDLGSTNGTYVNGARISGQQALNPGDTVQLGRSTITVEGGAAGGQATAIGAVPAGLPGAGGPPPPPPAAPPPAAAGPPTAQTQPLQAQGPGGPPPAGPGGPGYGPGGPGFGGPGDPNQKKNTGRIALIGGLIAAVIIGAVVLALVLSGGGDDDKDPTTQASTAQNTTPTTTPTTESTPTTTEETTTEETTTEESGGGGGGGLEDIPPATKKQFITQCASGGNASRSQCRCAINKLDQAYDFIEFIEIMQKAQRSGKFPPKALRLIRSCA